MFFHHFRSLTTPTLQNMLATTSPALHSLVRFQISAIFKTSHEVLSIIGRFIVIILLLFNTTSLNRQNERKQGNPSSCFDLNETEKTTELQGFKEEDISWRRRVSGGQQHNNNKSEAVSPSFYSRSRIITKPRLNHTCLIRQLVQENVQNWLQYACFSTCINSVVLLCNSANEGQYLAIFKSGKFEIKSWIL